MSLLQKASIITTPTAYAEDFLYSIKPVYALGENLVENGTFETAVTSSQWLDFGSPTTSERTSAKAYQGSFSYHIVGNASNEGIQASAAQFTGDYSVADKVRISAFVFPVVASSNEIKTGVSGSNRSITSTYSNLTLNVWNKIEYDIQITTASNNYITFLISGSAGEFYLDNVSAQVITNADFDFERSSTATRVNEEGLIEEVAIDTPRIDFTGGTGSILLEPSRTNLVTYSQDLSQWTLVNGTLTANATVSPEGIQNSGKIAFSSVGLDLKTTITVVAGTTYTISFYIKVESGTGLQGRFYDNSNSANIEYYNYDDQIIPNQWSRVTRSVTAPSGCTVMQIWLLASSTTLVTASWWGAQFEAGSYTTSYIPTNGSTQTRSADLADNAGNSDLINSTEGVLYAEISALANDSTYKQISLSDGTITNRIAIFYQNTSNQIGVESSGTGTNLGIYNQNLTITNVNKIALKYKANDCGLWINGVEVATDTSFTAFSSGILSQINFDKGDGSSVFYGKTKSVMVFKEALTDEELTKLTS